MLAKPKNDFTVLDEFISDKMQNIILIKRKKIKRILHQRNKLLIQLT